MDNKKHTRKNSIDIDNIEFPQFNQQINQQNNQNNQNNNQRSHFDTPFWHRIRAQPEKYANMITRMEQYN